MTALSAFELLMVCVRARKAYPDFLPADKNHRSTDAYFSQIAEKNAALDAVIEQLSVELRRILSTPSDESGGE